MAQRLNAATAPHRALTFGAPDRFDERGQSQREIFANHAEPPNKECGLHHCENNARWLLLPLTYVTCMPRFGCVCNLSVVSFFFFLPTSGKHDRGTEHRLSGANSFLCPGVSFPEWHFLVYDLLQILSRCLTATRHVAQNRSGVVELNTACNRNPAQRLTTNHLRWN